MVFIRLEFFQAFLNTRCNNMSKTEDDVYKQIKVSINEDVKGINGKVWHRKEKKQWVFGLFFGTAVLYACRTATPVCVAAMAKEFDWDKTQSGSILSCFFWGYTMTQFLGGYLADRVGGDFVMPLAACFWSLITFWTPVLAYLSTDKYLILHILVISRVILGVSQGFHYPSMSSLVSNKVLESERSLTYSLVCAGSHLGTLLCGSIGSLLLEAYGWQYVFYFCGVCSFVWMVSMKYFLVDRNKRKLLNASSPTEKALLLEKTPPKEYEPVPWVTLLVKPAFWSLLVGHFCENNAFYILLSWLPTFFHENYPDAKGWVFNVVPWVVTMFSSVISGWMADKLLAKGYSTTFVRKLMEAIALCGTSAALIIISYTSNYYAALFTMAIAVACCGFHNSGILVNPQDIAPKHAGAVFGIMNMAGAIPGFVGVYMAGHILEATKSWAAVFNQTAGVCMFGCMVYLLFGTGKRVV